MAIVYIGLGSNLNNPEQQLRNALKAIGQLPASELVADSGLFLSRAMTLPGDNETQPDYINAVARLTTSLSPHELLSQLQQIENQQGRVREKRWGARTLDLDILMYDELQISDERLTLPHPGIAERDFVLYPLQKIDKEICIPGQGIVGELIENVSDQNIHYLGEVK